MASRKKAGGKAGKKGEGLSPNKARDLLHEHKFVSPAQQRFLGAQSTGNTRKYGGGKKRGGGRKK